MPNYETVAQADARAKAPSAAERFFGVVQTDDMLDKQHIARVWAVSPPITQAQIDSVLPEVAADWEIEVEYRTFWNLCYRTRIPVVRHFPF